MRARYTRIMEQRRRLPLVIALAAWDTSWKVIAIRRAIRNRQYRWIAPLLFINSVGVFPMLYLSRFSRQAPDAGSGITESTARL